VTADFSPLRLVLIVGVAIGAYVIVLAIRALSRRVLQSRSASQTKVHTVTSFGSSLLVFAIYFGAVGFVLSGLGVSLTTYLASASPTIEGRFETRGRLPDAGPAREGDALPFPGESGEGEP